MIDSDIVYQARLHWIFFLWPIVLLCFAIYIGYEYEEFYQPSLFIALIAMIWLFMMWLNYQFSSLIIKKNQVILRTGVLVRQTIDIPLTKIESIDIRQSILGSMLQYGSLVITGTGGTRQMVNYLNKPLTCRRYIEQLMHGK